VGGEFKLEKYLLDSNLQPLEYNSAELPLDCYVETENDISIEYNFDDFTM